MKLTQTRTIVTAALNCVLFGCAVNPPSTDAARRVTPALPSAEPSRATTEAARAPLVLRLDAPTAPPPPGDRVALRLHVLRRGGLPGQVELRVSLPPGATLVEGDLAATIADDGAAETIRPYVLAVGPTLPEGDVTFTASLAGEHFGATARAVYRFGRPENTSPRGDGRPVLGLPANAIRLEPPPPVNGIRPPATPPLPPRPAP